MKNTNTSSSSDKVFYHYEFGISFAILLLLPIVAGVLMKFFSQDYSTLSPFISSPHGVLNSFSEWIYNCDPDGKVKFFVTDMIFGPSFIAFVIFLFAGFYFTKIEEREDESSVMKLDGAEIGGATSSVRTFFFNKQNFWNLINPKVIKSPLVWGFLMIAISAAILDVVENSLFLANWDDPIYRNPDTWRFNTLWWIQQFKVVAFAVSIGYVLYQAIYWFILDYFQDQVQQNYGQFVFGTIKELVEYFYPAIISMGILALIFSTYNTFDTLIIEVLYPANYLIFMAFFAFSVLKVWFIPYYLKYNDNFFEKIRLSEDLNKDLREDYAKSIKDTLFSRWSLFFPIKFMLNKLEKREKFSEEQKKLKQKIEATANNPNINPFFNLLRRGLGFCFILVLLWLEGGTLDNALGTGYLQGSLLGGCILSMIIYVMIYLRCINKALPKRLQPGERKKGKMRTTHVKFHRAIVWSNSILTLVLLVFLFIYPNSYWFPKLIGLTLNTFLLSFSFMGFALYRRIRERYDFEGQDHEAYNKSYTGWDERITSKFMPIYLGLSLTGLILVLLISCFVDINSFTRLNPLNLYLIYINGIIAFVAIIDRFFTLVRMRSDFQVGGGKIEERMQRAILMHKTTNKRIRFFILTSIVVFSIVILQRGENHYHDIDYVEYGDEKYNADSILSLAEYTQQFLERSDASKPIILVAADGGGLRAAYWTMLVMNHLENDPNTDFSKNLFMTTGISGGGIGLGMYTYAKARGMDAKAINVLASRIGRTNFLSGDLTGMMGKAMGAWVLPTFFNLNSWEDRMEAMGRHYFEICNSVDRTENEFGEFKKEPFHKLWVDRNYDLPLLVVNTARSEDGARGIVHPLRYRDDNRGFVDLSKTRSKYISYPDALFLTNRFPIISPAARIEGKGHFVDGGYLENSGLSTILYYLQEMKVTPDPVYQEFLKRDIIVLSIKNDKGSYVQSQFNYPQDSINRSKSSGEISSILGAAASPGTTALPMYYEKLFETEGYLPKLLNLDSSDYSFKKICLPFRMAPSDIHNAYYGQVTDCDIPTLVKEKNEKVLKHYQQKQGKENTWGKNIAVVPPPLGRMISKATAEYMQDMLEFESVDSVLSEIKSELPN